MDQNEKELRLQIKNLENEIQDLKVVINTAQVALTRAEYYLKENPEQYNNVFTQSAVWAWKFKI